MITLATVDGCGSRFSRNVAVAAADEAAQAPLAAHVGNESEPDLQRVQVGSTLLNHEKHGGCCNARQTNPTRPPAT